MRPDPVMDLVLLAAIMLGAIMLFVILWLLVRKYSIAPLAEPPRGEYALSDVASSQRRSSKTSLQRASVIPSAATGRAVAPAPDSETRPGAKTQCTTSLPSTDENRQEVDHGKAVAAVAPKQGDLTTGTAKSRNSGPERRDDDTDAQNKPKASSRWVVAKVGDNEATKQPSKAKSLAEDIGVAPTGAVKKSSGEEDPGTDGVRRTSEGQAAREETSVVTSMERTTTKDQRHHKKSKKQQQRDGGGSDGGGSASATIPEVGCDADTTTTKRKRKSRRRKDSRHTTGAEGFVSSGLSSAEEERSQGGAFVPKSHSSSRRLSTKSRTSRKSAISDDARSDAAASPPAGWATGQVPAENIDAAAATAATAATGGDDIFLPELPEMGGKDAQPPTPPHPNMDVFSREHSAMIAVAEPVGAALTPVGASGQITPDVIHTPTGACKAPTPMKPNLDVFSRERSPCVPASPHKATTPPLPPQDET